MIYVGDVYGVRREGERRDDEEGKKRVGAAIVTQDFFGSSRVEMRAKLTRFQTGTDSGGGGVVNSK